MRPAGPSRPRRSIRCASAWQGSASACWCCVRTMTCGKRPRACGRCCRAHVSRSCSTARARYWRTRRSASWRRRASFCAPEHEDFRDISHTFAVGRAALSRRGATLLRAPHRELGTSMSTRPMPPRSAASQANPDLDSTAELPVLDPPATAATETPTATVEIAKPSADDRHASTDSWPLAPPPRTALAVAAASADARRRHEAELQSRAKELRETQERLAAHGKRLLQLEHARDEALAAQAAAAQRAAGSEQRASAAEQRATAAEQ